MLLYMVISERESYYDGRSGQESERGEEFIERTDAIRAIAEGMDDLE